MGPSNGFVITLILLLARGCLSGTRHDDICGDYNGRKLYLELGHRGFLSARDVAPDVTPKGGTPTNITSAHHQCGMELVTCPSCVITVIFHFMNMSTCSQDGSCRCDYIWITEPPYEASGAPFCGYVKSPPAGTGDIGQAEYFGAFPRGYRDTSPAGYRSRTRTLALALLFASPHSHAFTLEYFSERNRQYLKGYRPSINSNETTGGFLTSPFFPAPYPRDLGAEYIINSPDSNARVRLLFTDFQLSGSSIIEFYDWNGQRLEVSSGASFRPPVVLSSGPSLLVRFYANGGTGLGYKASYSFITGRIPENLIKPVTDCGGFVENIGGAITMMEMVPPGSVRAYDCVWIVRPPKFRAHMKTHLYLRVAQFQDMGGSTELHVRQGTTSETPLLEVLRLPSPSATAPLRHHSLSSRYRRHAPLSIDHPQRRTRLFGWMQRPYSAEVENSEPAEVAMSLVGEEEVTKETEPTFGMQTNLVDVQSEAVAQWETTMPTTGAPSSPQALVGSSVTESPRSPPPNRRRPPPPIAGRKQVGREHVLPLEVGFYVSLRGTFAHDSRLSIVFTAFSYMNCFTGSDIMCKNHRCIPKGLTCDGFDHCGDASDELLPCLENGEGNGPMEGGGNMGMIGGMGGDSGIDRHWYSHTPNYYFPKMERYPDLKTATLVFIVSSLGLILLIAALIILLYRMGSRARQHRELQNRLQTISDLLGEYDGARIEEISTDDPPDYEAPPTYEDVVKAVNGPNGDCCSTSGLVPAPEEDCPIRAKERRGEGRRRARPRAGSNPTSSSCLQDDSDSSLPPPDISALIPPPPPPPLHTSSRSCQTTLIPDSPPPTYETALLRASRSLQANILQNTSPPLFPAISSGPQSGFNSPPSTAPSSLPYMQTVPEDSERYLSTSETEDGHSIMTDASLLDGGEMEQQISVPDMSGSENENQDPGEGTSAGGSPTPEEPPQSPEDGEVSTKPAEEGSKEEAAEETLEVESERDQADEASSSTQAPGSEAEADGVAKEKSEGEEKPDAEKESETEAEKKQGEVEIDKTEPEIDKSLPGRSNDEIPVEASSSSDKIEPSALVEDDNKKEDGETFEKEIGTSEEQKDVSGVKEEDGDGNESEEECSERQNLIDRSKEVGEEGVRLREGNEVDEVGEDALEVKEVLKEGKEWEKKGTKSCKGKEEVKESSNSSRVLKDGPKCASSSREGELSKSSKEQKEPFPHEIVGGLVKGHIKLFQGMSSSKDEDEGDARVLRRRVAMRGWRSVDVGCGERLLEN